MFYYYGSKSKVVHLYPTPKFDTIIEPFAGSARYSLRFWQKNIIINDKSELVIDVWNYLKQVTPQEIMSLPKLKKGDDLRNFTQLSEIEVKFLGFFCQAAQAKQVYKVSKMSAFETVNNPLKLIADNLFKIKHWTIRHGDFKDLENVNATWFIDPPYQYGGEFQYKYNNKNLDFMQLSEWCKQRNGHVIVCENTKANWLNFKPVIKQQGAANTATTEAIWSNYPTNFDYQMQSLF